MKGEGDKGWGRGQGLGMGTRVGSGMGHAGRKETCGNYDSDYGCLWKEICTVLEGVPGGPKQNEELFNHLNQLNCSAIPK